jgi:hypothetical protein
VTRDSWCISVTYVSSHKVYLKISALYRLVRLPSLIHGHLSFKLRNPQPFVQGGSNMTGTNCDLFTHNQSRSYLNHLVPTTLTTVFLKHVYHSWGSSRNILWGNQGLTYDIFLSWNRCLWKWQLWWLSRAWLSHSQRNKQKFCIAQLWTREKGDHLRVFADMSRVFITLDMLQWKVLVALWMACVAGTEGHLFSLWSNKALKLSCEESINRRHSFPALCLPH